MLTLQDLIQGLPKATILANDAKIQRGILTVSDTVNASTTKPTSYQVPPLAPFLCYAITGSFTTLDAGPADNGICKMSMKFRNGSGRVYIPDLVSMDLVFTPGRVKDSAVVGADAGNQLQFPGMPFMTVFRQNDTLSFEVQNAGTYANSWNVAFHGFWLLG